MATIQGTSGADTLIGGSSDDVLIGLGGSDRLYGGDGKDTAQIDSQSFEGRIIRYDTHSTHDSYAALGLDTLTDIEYVTYLDRTVRVREIFLGENYQAFSENDLGSTYTAAQQLSVGTDYLVSGNITVGDRDFYKLNITSPTDIELELSGLSNNLSLRLWNDFNNNGRVDSGEHHSNYQSGLAKEYLFRSDRWAGNWYAEIWSPTSGITSPYQLRVASRSSIGSAPSTGRNLGDIYTGGTSYYKGQAIQASPKNVTVNGATVGELDNQDWYKFSLSQRQKLTTNLNFTDGYGSAWAEIFDSGMNRVAIADTSASNEQLNKILNPGNYYLKIFDQIGSSQNQYSLNLQTSNPYLQGLYAGNNPTFREDGVIDLSLSESSPMPGVVPTDNYVVSWAGKLKVPTSGYYDLFLTSDDGAKLFIDGQLILNNWGNHPFSEISTSVYLTAGLHDISVPYYENGAYAGVQLSWQGQGIPKQVISNQYLSSSDPLPGTGTGLRAQYFNSTDFTGTPVLDRTDPLIFYSWGDVAPNSYLGKDYYSIRWTGKIDIQQANSYTFTLFSDDGSRLWIDNQLVVDNWGGHGLQFVDGSISLSQGLHDIRIDYYENWGDANVGLMWQSSTIGQQYVPTSVLHSV